MELALPTSRGRQYQVEIEMFADALLEIDKEIGFKVSSRGWCYQLEGFRLVNKDQFGLVQNIINKCRKNGLLPIDFTAEEEGRKFSGVAKIDEESYEEYMKDYIKSAMECGEWYTPDWWEDEDYYIQMLVEKIDLKTLFKPVCEDYRIPIATSKGWSSILQRGEYARRFQEAEDNGLKCVLLYCGDFDPDGGRISDFLRKNLKDIEDIEWEDGMEGYIPDDLIIKRFGLDYDFIIEHNLTWIDNLITGSKKNLADPTHKNHFMPYVQKYLRDVGERKCEANAIVTKPQMARKLCRESIEKYLGDDAQLRFRGKRTNVIREFKEIREKLGIEEPLNEALKLFEEDDDDEE